MLVINPFFFRFRGVAHVPRRYSIVAAAAKSLVIGVGCVPGRVAWVLAGSLWYCLQICLARLGTGTFRSHVDAEVLMGITAQVSAGARETTPVVFSNARGPFIPRNEGALAGVGSLGSAPTGAVLQSGVRPSLRIHTALKLGFRVGINRIQY